MRIENNCCKIGYHAVYVEYEHKITVRCVNKSDNGDPGTTPGIIGIKNVKVKITSTYGSVIDTKYSNKNGYCYFYNLPKDLEYEVTANHPSWSQERVEWVNDNFTFVWMIGGKIRSKMA